MASESSGRRRRLGTRLHRRCAGLSDGAVRQDRLRAVLALESVKNAVCTGNVYWRALVETRIPLLEAKNITSASVAGLVQMLLDLRCGPQLHRLAVETSSRLATVVLALVVHHFRE